jgi:hypothetical protein
VFGGLVASFVNRWICDGLLGAAEKYYSAPFLGVDQDRSIAMPGLEEKGGAGCFQ